MRRAVLGLTLMIVTAVGAAWLLDASIDHTEEGIVATSDNRAALAAVKSWGYQLQGLQPDRVAASAHDLIVVDESLDDLRGLEKSRALAALKRKSDGGRRIVLSYLSIGEAEDYRAYWKPGWAVPAKSASSSPLRLVGFSTGALPNRTHGPRSTTVQAAQPSLVPSGEAPHWLGAENPEWRGNFSVRFWDQDWKDLLFGNPKAALDRVIEAGFDGVYLDRADVYSLWRKEQASAKADMVDLVMEIAAYARRKSPRFLIVLQNAEELLANARLRRALDGVAKEDLLYGVEAEGRENSADEVTASLRYLRQARTEGLPVLVVEYLADLPAINVARKRLENEGFVAYFGPRALDMLVQRN